MSEFTATLSLDGYAEIKDGPFIRRISIQDYLSVITILAGEKESVSEGLAFRYPSSIHSVKENLDGYTLVMYYSERVVELSHISGRFTVPMPNVLIKVPLIEVNGQKGVYAIGQVKWFATDLSPSEVPLSLPDTGSTRDHIWTLPMPNMYSSAEMCYGDNRLPSVIYTDWSTLTMMYEDVFLGSPFNNDLTIPNLDYSGIEWLRHLDGLEEFPYNELPNY